MGIGDIIRTGFNQAFGDQLIQSKLMRNERVLKQGSPKYHYDVTAILATESVAFDLHSEFPKARKYFPLDTMVIINNDAVAISVRVNSAQGDLYIVPAGAIRVIGKEELGAVHWVEITNMDTVTAITAGKIDIEFQKSPLTTDELARLGV